MSGKGLLSISSFEWASVARYLRYISDIADLKEVNSDHVISFPLARLGYEKTLRRKRTILNVLKGNIRALERFVGKFEDELGEEEVTVIRSMYRQYLLNIATVESHVSAARMYENAATQNMFSQAEVEDDFPF